MKLTSMSLTDYQMIDNSVNQKMVDALLSAYEQIELCKREFKKNFKECPYIAFDGVEHENAVIDLWCKIKYDEHIQDQNYIITLNK
jgi:uncharacterized pyridoxamine 5'-phosphate oxidase family protein